MTPMVPDTKPPRNVLELEGLEMRLVDPQRREQFLVRVKPRLQIPQRSIVAILGPSGCGKTTLLTVLGLLRSPSHPAELGEFMMRTPGPAGNWIEHDLKQIWQRRKLRQVERLRREHLGFALQSGELLPALTVRENISVPLRLNGFSYSRRQERVNELLACFQLDGSDKSALEGPVVAERNRQRLANSRVNKLSGGEYQRVALARAIAHRPTLVFVDEPTSALNRELAWGALTQLRALQCSASSQGAAIMITHDESLAEAFADVIVRMAPVKGQAIGEVVEIVPNNPLVIHHVTPGCDQTPVRANDVLQDFVGQSASNSIEVGAAAQVVDVGLQQGVAE